jgi:hypothetical protein
VGNESFVLNLKMSYSDKAKKRVKREVKGNKQRQLPSGGGSGKRSKRQKKRMRRMRGLENAQR